MSFSVEENAVLIHEFSKYLPTVTPPSHTPPPPSLAPLARARSLRSLAYYRPKIKSWLRHWPEYLECTQKAVRIFRMHFEYPGM